MDDDESRKATGPFALGEDLSTLSIEELERRISVLESEIARLKSAINQKQDSRSAAETFFRS